jgi:hypothetical protein
MFEKEMQKQKRPQKCGRIREKLLA